MKLKVLDKLMLFIIATEWSRAWQTLPVKGQAVNILGFVLQPLNSAVVVKAPTDNM